MSVLAYGLLVERQSTSLIIPNSYSLNHLSIFLSSTHEMNTQSVNMLKPLTSLSICFLFSAFCHCFAQHKKDCGVFTMLNAKKKSHRPKPRKKQRHLVSFHVFPLDQKLQSKTKPEKGLFFIALCLCVTVCECLCLLLNFRRFPWIFLFLIIIFIIVAGAVGVASFQHF